MTTRFFGSSTQLVGVIALLCAMGCASAKPESSGQAQSNVNGACAAEAEDEDGPEDKVVCSIDTDCDSDEVCLNGKCTGMDGDAEDEDDCGETQAKAVDAAADDPDDADSANESDQADDEGGADKIYCSADADCDADELCVNGKCD